MAKMKKPWIRRPGSIIGLGALALGVIAALAFTLSPWPAALLIRALFERGAQNTIAEMEPYAPTDRIDERRDLSYGPSENSTFDVFRPTGPSGALPTVVWIHGGAWISGVKEDVEPYAKMIAAEGFAVVALDYSVSPEVTYPTALTELNDALAHVVANADDLGIDPTRIVIAGDSAGAQLTSQLATMITNPEYATLVGLEPALDPQQLAGVILNCGIYDVSGIPNAPGVGGWGFRIALWSYLGERDWSTTASGAEMSTLDYVTEDFPTTWISGGNDDPLTATQSIPLAQKLEGLGVDVSTVFYPEGHSPALPHEYQFHLDFQAARDAFDSTIEFLNRELR